MPTPHACYHITHRTEPALGSIPLEGREGRHLREAVEERLWQPLAAAALLQRVLASKHAERGRALERGGELGHLFTDQRCEETPFPGGHSTEAARARGT